MQNINIESPIEKELREQLNNRHDVEAERMKRYLNMPDLSRTPGSPIYELVERITASPEYKNFDIIKVPEIVPADMSFDLFNFPPDHPARSKSDTYYVDDKNILRTHTTVMWYYYLTSPEGKAKVAANEPISLLSYGKVYRKDEIDRHHMNVFHQIDGLYLLPKKDGVVGIEDLQKALLALARAAFGDDLKYRFNHDTFPYTDPSLEMEMDKNGQWVEVGGAGVVHPEVLEKLGVNRDQYTGWAFGPGLDRLSIISMELPDIRLLWSEDERVKRQLKLGQKYVDVSKYPSIVRDISFVVDKSFEPNNYFDLIRDIGGDLVEEVKLLDKYENAEKFGADKVSYTYRITYRSHDRTLESSEVDPLQDKVYAQTAEQFKAELR